MEFMRSVLMHDRKLAILGIRVQSSFLIAAIGLPDRFDKPLNPCSKSSA